MVTTRKRLATIEHVSPAGVQIKKARFQYQEKHPPPSEQDEVETCASSQSQPFTEHISIGETSMTSHSTFKRPKRYLCEYEGCDKAFDRPVRLQAHQRTHTNDRPFVCEHKPCTKAFFKSEHLKAHIENKHGGEANHICVYVVSVNEDGEEFECGKAFVTATRLRRHVATHEQKEHTKCQEPGCGKVFRKIDTLQRHIRKDHLKEKAYVCTHIVYAVVEGEQSGSIPDECGQAFATVSQLKGHENRDHAGNKYFCDLCPLFHLTQDQEESVCSEDLPFLGFPTYAEFQIHNKNFHPPRCPTCNKSCESNRALIAHMDIEHVALEDRQQRFKCVYPGCTRGFTRQGNLNVHVQNVHVKRRGFICGQFNLSNNDKCPGWDSHGCGASFGTKANLECHVRTQHLALPGLSKRKPKVKTEDGESMLPSLQYDVLPSHANKKQEVESTGNALSMLTGYGYANQRPIACWDLECQRRFVRNFDLAQHMELHHGWNVDDINERTVEQEALQGDKFWIGGDEELIDERFDETEVELRQNFTSILNLPPDGVDGHGNRLVDFAETGTLQDTNNVTQAWSRGDSDMVLDPALA